MTEKEEDKIYHNPSVKEHIVLMSTLDGVELSHLLKWQYSSYPISWTKMSHRKLFLLFMVSILLISIIFIHFLYKGDNSIIKY